MAKAALMVEETEELEELEVPTGGIGDFVMDEVIGGSLLMFAQRS